MGLACAADGSFYGATELGTGPAGSHGTIFHLDANGENPALVFGLENLAANVVGISQRIVAGSDGAIYAWYHATSSSGGDLRRAIQPEAGG